MTEEQLCHYEYNFYSVLIVISILGFCRHLLFFAGRKSTLWLRVWYQCPGLCGNVHSAEFNECIHNILWMRSQCIRILPAPHGGSLCLRCLLFATVSIYKPMKTNLFFPPYILMFMNITVCTVCNSAYIKILFAIFRRRVSRYAACSSIFSESIMKRFNANIRKKSH